MAHVHRHLLQRTAALPADFGRGQRAGGQCRLCGHADGEGRGQHRLVAGQVRLMQALGRQACGTPQAAQRGFGRLQPGQGVGHRGHLANTLDRKASVTCAARSRVLALPSMLAPVALQLFSTAW